MFPAIQMKIESGVATSVTLQENTCEVYVTHKHDPWRTRNTRSHILLLILSSFSPNIDPVMDAFIQAPSMLSLPPCGPVEVIFAHVLQFNCFGYCYCFDRPSARDQWCCVDGEVLGCTRNINTYPSIELVLCNLQKYIICSHILFWYADRVLRL